MLACDVPMCMKHYAEFSFDHILYVWLAGSGFLDVIWVYVFFFAFTALACFATERKIYTLTVLDLVISR